MIIYEQIFKKSGLSKTQLEIIKIIGKDKRVLEIGSSTGYMTKFFLDNNCLVDIVETDKNACLKLPKGVRKVFNYSIEDRVIKKLLNKDYDFIIMADVLEHLINPENALNLLHHIASKNCQLIISMPNIASWVMRKQLFFKGDFEYKDSGLLDRTHLHFYTIKTLPKLLLENGWKVREIEGTITRLPFEETIFRIPLFSWIFKQTIYKNLVERYKNLSYYHFLVVSNKQ